MYAVAARIQGAKVVEVPLRRGRRLRARPRGGARGTARRRSSSCSCARRTIRPAICSTERAVLALADALGRPRARSSSTRPTSSSRPRPRLRAGGRARPQLARAAHAVQGARPRRRALRRADRGPASHRAAAQGDPALCDRAADASKRRCALLRPPGLALMRAARGAGAHRTRAPAHRARCACRRHRGCGRARPTSCWCDFADADASLARARRARLLVRDVRSAHGLERCAAHHRRHAGAERRDCSRGLGMNARPTLFIDRDGTLIEEPADEQVDRLEKIRFMPGVFAALVELVRARLPPGHGHATRTASARRLPAGRASSAAQEFMLEAFRSQGVSFEAVFICPHRSGGGLRVPQARHRAARGRTLLSTPIDRAAQRRDRRSRHRPEACRQPRRARLARYARAAARRRPGPPSPGALGERARARVAPDARDPHRASRSTSMRPRRPRSPPASASSITCSSSSPSTAALR